MEEKSENDYQIACRLVYQTFERRVAAAGDAIEATKALGVVEHYKMLYESYGNLKEIEDDFVKRVEKCLS